MYSKSSGEILEDLKFLFKDVTFDDVEFNI